jgi:hypothetical protein
MALILLGPNIAVHEEQLRACLGGLRLPQNGSDSGLFGGVALLVELEPFIKNVWQNGFPYLCKSEMSIMLFLFFLI